MVLFFVGEVLEVHTDDGGLSKQEGVCLYVCMRERQRERERERGRERETERERQGERETQREALETCFWVKESCIVSHQR